MLLVLRSIHLNFKSIFWLQRVSASPHRRLPAPRSWLGRLGQSALAATWPPPQVPRPRASAAQVRIIIITMGFISVINKILFLFFQTPFPRPRPCERSRPPAAPRGPHQRAAHAQPRRRGERRAEAPRPAVGQTFGPKIPQIDDGRSSRQPININ